MPRYRRCGTDDADVTLRLEQLSSKLATADHTDPCSDAHAEIVHKMRRKLCKSQRKLHDISKQVEAEQAVTEELRHYLQHSHETSRARHSEFMSWYRSQHNQIDEKYRRIGIHVPSWYDGGLRYKFTSNLSERGTPYLDEEACDDGLTPSPVRGGLNDGASPSPLVRRRLNEILLGTSSPFITLSAPQREECENVLRPPQAPDSREEFAEECRNVILTNDSHAIPVDCVDAPPFAALTRPPSSSGGAIDRGDASIMDCPFKVGAKMHNCVVDIHTLSHNLRDTIEQSRSMLTTQQAEQRHDPCNDGQSHGGSVVIGRYCAPPGSLPAPSSAQVLPSLLVRF